MEKARILVEREEEKSVLDTKPARKVHKSQTTYTVHAGSERGHCTSVQLQVWETDHVT